MTVNLNLRQNIAVMIR